MGTKSTFRAEFQVDGPLKVVRPHRQFFNGAGAVSKPIKIELEFGELEDVYACADVDTSEGEPGRSARCEVEGLVFTATPTEFGTDADRTAAGKLTFKKLNFGEWNVLNIEQL